MKHRKQALIFVAAVLVFAIACRGGTGTGGSTDIPVFTQTAVPQVCENDGYPSDAPQFGDDSDIDYTVTESGLSIFERVVGTGPSPDPVDTVLVEFTGFLVDGCIFGSSRARSGPSPFIIEQLIPGMEEGMTGMKVGGSRRIKIPSVLGYQDLGIPGRIPPDSTIIFELELVGINPGANDGPAGDLVEEPTQTTSGN